MNTFGWTYRVRGLDVPETVPCVRLGAPSGAVWEWNESETGNTVEGTAVDFCRVVTQVRNIGDTQLRVRGKVANELETSKITNHHSPIVNRVLNKE